MYQKQLKNIKCLNFWLNMDQTLRRALCYHPLLVTGNIDILPFIKIWKFRHEPPTLEHKKFQLITGT